MIVPEIPITETAVPEGELHRLQNFAEVQLTPLAASELLHNTAALVTACAFFHGACEVFFDGRRSSDAPAALALCLQTWFHLPADNAHGLLQAVAGLVRRYRYLAAAEELGRRCALGWEDGAGREALLAAYLRRHAHVTMADLGFAGMTMESEPTDGGEERQGRAAAVFRRRRFVRTFLILTAAAAACWIVWRLGLVEMPW